MKAHRWHKFRRCPWLICRCCGLMYLRNDATERAVRRGCDAEDESE